ASSVRPNWPAYWPPPWHQVIRFGRLNKWPTILSGAAVPPSEVRANETSRIRAAPFPRVAGTGASTPAFGERQKTQGERTAAFRLPVPQSLSFSRHRPRTPLQQFSGGSFGRSGHTCSPAALPPSPFAVATAVAIRRAGLSFAGASGTPGGWLGNAAFSASLDRLLCRHFAKLGIGLHSLVTVS